MRRVIQTVVEVLQARVAALLADDVLWTEDCEDDYTAAEIVRLKAEFRAHPPEVLKGYPRQEARFPRWAVVLYGGDSIDFCGGGRTGNFTTETTPREYVEMGLNQRVGVEVYVANSPEGCELHAMLATKGLLAGFETFVNAKIDGKFCGGVEDLHPMQRGLPDNVYIRAQAWEFLGMVQTIAARETGLIHGPAKVALDDMDMDGAGTLGEVHPWPAT